ncbi:MAG: hypothetical protein EHM33_14260 [Chloroflexi bacterium]|nr:MAG: hypothetical protein EHM33_14260 [Chloroflexota bacterium]
MDRSTDDQEKRLTELKKEVLKRGFDRYSSRLKNVSELPIELQSSAVTVRDSHETIQTILVFPPQIQRGWHYVPKQALLFTATGVTHLLASIWPDKEPQVTPLKGCDLMYMKVALLLLYGFLEIVAQGESEPVRLGMEFNTVDWYRLSPPLQCFLEATKVTSDLTLQPADTSSLVTQRAFEELPLKFSNGLRIYGLLPGEKLEEFVFQTATWKRWLYFFQRPVSANTLLSLTSNYMVVIQEELKVKQGWIISYIPRNSITGIQNQPCGLWNELSVRLAQESQSIDYKLKLKSEAVEVWRRQWVQHGGVWEDLPEQQA